MNWLIEVHGEEKVLAMVERAKSKPVFAQLLVDAGDDVFGVWLIGVNRHLRQVGVGYRDLADWAWRDAFDGGMSPADAAREALAADEIGCLMLAGL